MQQEQIAYLISQYLLLNSWAIQAQEKPRPFTIRRVGHPSGCADAINTEWVRCYALGLRYEVERIIQKRKGLPPAITRTFGEEIVIVLYACYFDASGKSHTHEFMTIGGAGSTSEKWGQFEKEWSQILKREGVTEFHATDFAGSFGEYKDWKGNKGRRSHFLRDLIAVAQKHTNKLFTGTIAMSDWRYVNTQYALEENFFSPYAYVGLGLANQAVWWAKRRKVADASFLVAFEDGDEGWGGLRNLCMKYLKFEPIRIPKRQARAFQLGDMLAWKTRITAVNATKTPDVKQIEKHLAQLDKLIFRPAFQAGVRRQSLIANCRRFGVPQRDVLT